MRRTIADLVAVLLFGAVLALPLTACTKQPSRVAETAAERVRYRCPMHHAVVAEHPGSCPICRMELVAFVPGDATQPASSVAPAVSTPGPAERKVLYWFDPMQPGAHFDHPGKSPLMDMDLVPRYADEETAAPTAAAASVLRLSPAAVRAAGVATEPAEERALSRALHLSGTIEIDETRRVRIASRVAGRIERLYLDFVGQRVGRGAPIYELWSPELQTSAGELRLAIANRERARQSDDAAYLANADGLVSAAEQRLLRFGAEPRDVEAWMAGAAARPSLRVRSPIAGTVLEKSVLAGQYVTEGQDLYQIADLSRVWLVARLYEADVAAVHVGQEVTARVVARPAEPVRGQIAFLDPVLDPATRTTRARIDLPNAAGALLPGMFAEADIALDLGRRLAVRKSAVLDTGTRRLVYVERGEAQFEPRSVEIGAAAGDWVEIRAGLVAGERVVTTAGFLIDAQAQLQAGTAVQWSGALSPKSPGDGGNDQ